MIFTRLLSHRFGVCVNDVLVNDVLVNLYATLDHGTSGLLQRIILHQAGIHFNLGM